MKSFLYCISILTISLAVCSCSKKDNSDNQQTPGKQELVSEINNTEQAQPEQVSESNEIIQNTNIKIVPVPSQETLTISPEDAILILQAIDFSDSQVQDLAPVVCDALSKSGAVRILIDDEVQAGLAVRGDEVFISSRTKGQFIYNIKTGWVNSPR